VIAILCGIKISGVHDLVLSALATETKVSMTTSLTGSHSNVEYAQKCDWKAVFGRVTAEFSHVSCHVCLEKDMMLGQMPRKWRLGHQRQQLFDDLAVWTELISMDCIVYRFVHGVAYTCHASTLRWKIHMFTVVVHYCVRLHCARIFIILSAILHLGNISFKAVCHFACLDFYSAVDYTDLQNVCIFVLNLVWSL